MFPISLVFWKILPKLQFMQFPWRWLLCLSLIFTIFVAVGLRRWWARALVCGASVILIVAVWHGVQAPWWDNAADLREMQDNMSDHIGYEGTDEYTPRGAEPSEIDKDERNVTVNGPAKGAIVVRRWDAEMKLFTADLSAPDRLNVKLFPYPAWRVTVNGHEVQTSRKEDSGQMLVPVEAGMNHIEIRFVRTWDRTAGGWISVITLLGISGWSVAARRARYQQGYARQRSVV
jgi:hypothetical protein